MIRSFRISLLAGLALLLATAADAVTLMSTATGNIGATATWSVVDTTGANAFLNSETANTALTTSPVASSTFTPAASTVTSIGVKLASVAAAPSGTLTVKLANSTSPGSRECTLTVNVADLAATNGAPAASTADGGWIILACSASPNGTDSYTITANTSVAAQVNLFSLATTNWSRLLVTSGTQSGGPAAGDKFYVFGKLTGAGTNAAYVVTIDTTSGVAYGNVANTLVDPSIAVGQGGTLQFGSTASTAYVSGFAGPMVIYNGGTYSVGTAGTPIPASGSATLTMNSTVEGDTGINVRNGGTMNVAGSSGGRNVVKTKLSTAINGATPNATAFGTNSGGQKVINLNTLSALAPQPKVGQVVANTTVPASITGGSTVASITGSQITLNINLASQVSNGDTITFTGGESTAAVTTDSTGWLSGDSIIISATNVNQTNNDTGYRFSAATLSGNATGTSSPLTGFMANDHIAKSLSYTSTSTGVAYSMNMYADVVLLTRNVIIQGNGASTNGYIYFQANAVGAMTWVQFSRISGAGNIAGKRGVEVDIGAAGSFSLTNFVFINSHNTPLILAPTNALFGGASGSYLTVQNGAIYNCATDASNQNYGLGLLSGTKNPFWKIDNFSVLRVGNATTNVAAILLASQNGVFTNISASGSASGSAAAIYLQGQYGSQSNLGGGVGNQFGPITTYANVGYGIANTNYGLSGTLSGLYMWHEGGRYQPNTQVGSLIIDPFYLITSQFGIYIPSNAGNAPVFRNGVIGWDGSLSNSFPLTIDATTVNVSFENMEICPNGSVGGIVFVGCNDGPISLMHDVYSGGNAPASAAKVFLKNSSLLSAGNNPGTSMTYNTQHNEESVFGSGSYIVQDCNSCTPVKHAAWVPVGFLSYDTTITHSSGYSLRMTPKVPTYTGYIAGKTITVTSTPNTGANGQVGDMMTSNCGGFIPGTVGTSTPSGATWSVSQSQTACSSGTPGQFQFYNTLRGNRMHSAPADRGLLVGVAAGQVANVCVWARPSISTDGAQPWGGSAVTYNADAPRMIVRANPYMGVQSDTVMGTSSLTAGSWSQFCANTPTAPADGEFEIVVDADQTFTSSPGGSINLAEWSCTNCGATNNTQYWWNGAPASGLAPPATGGLLVNPGMHGGMQ